MLNNQEDKLSTTGRKVRTHLAQIDVTPGQPSVNTDRILSAIEGAKKDSAELVVFSEMAVPGFSISDVWEREAFLRECETCGNEIREASSGTTVIFGNVAIDWNRRNEDGRVRKYNALFVAEDGRFIGPVNGPYEFVVKSGPANYGAFDDSRHFHDLRKLALEEGTTVELLISPVVTRHLSLGCILSGGVLGANHGDWAIEVLSRHPINFLVVVSCSRFTMNEDRGQDRFLSAHATACSKPLVYVSSVGIQNDGKRVYMFDGSSCVYDGTGRRVARVPAFEEGVLRFDIPLTDSAKFGAPVETEKAGGDRICQALLYGIRGFMNQVGVSRVVTGVSGGIDSAVVAALYSLVVDRENLLLASIPSRLTSPTSLALAKDLAANLGCYYAELPIDESVSLTASQINGLEIASADNTLRMRLNLSDFMMENVQARDRSARVLAALAAAFGGVFTCNANKSEATVGYTTLYGDLTGYLAPVADLWKGEIYELARYLNEQVFQRETIPRGCIDRVPSAELSLEQNVDEGKGDPLIYPYHDRLFASWVEWRDRTSPEEILEWYVEGTLEKRIGYDGTISDLFEDTQAFVADLERWWGQYQGLGVAKRVQAPPVLAVKERPFGFDCQESQMGLWTSRRYEELKKRALA